MIVLSLFDGYAGGLESLKRAGIKVDKYYASEVDKYAIQIAMKNHPEMIHLGDVTKWREWDIGKPDVIIAGSPCQGFSFAGKQFNFNDERSKLFFDFVDILKHYKPKYFLLENVKMKKEYQDVISKIIGVDPIEINSALVSAQNRKRLYWTNIIGVTQPEDRGIFLKDIIEGNEMSVMAGRIVGRARVNGKRIDHKQSVAGITNQELEINKNPQKTNTLSTVSKDNVLVLKKVSKDICKKTKNYIQYDLNNTGNDSCDQRLYYKHTEKGRTLSANISSIIKVIEAEDGDYYYYRNFTVIECERLQTLPDNYTEGVSNTQRYKMLGNGFNIETVTHILGSMK